MKNIRQIDIKTEIELRETSDGKRTLVGLIPYNKRSVDMGFIEVITNTAFSKTLADGADVKALVSHDTSKVLGRVKNGTLRLASSSDGLICEIDLPNTTFGNDVYETVKRGDVTTMSFGFYPVKETVEIENKEEVHYLLEVRLLEVSFAVAWPAYEDTTSYARQLRGIDIAKLETILAKSELTNEDRTALAEIDISLKSLMEPMGTSGTVAVPNTTAADGFLESLLGAAKLQGE